MAATANAAIPDRERSALLTVFNTLDGPNWNNKEGWGGAPGTECNWYGVTCDNAQSTVIELDLGSDNLHGPFPAAVADLANLENLDLNDSGLTGSIPPELSRLTKLKKLRLSYNALSGPIPASLGSMTTLTNLEIEENALTGPIPPELGGLPRLGILLLYANQLSGSIPRELGNLVALQELEVEYNKLSGALPTEIGNLSQLTSLSVNNNALSGAIPVELGNLRNLDVLDLSGNQFSGTIPSQLGNLTLLRQLWLQSNRLTGTVPSTIFALARLERLGLAQNELTGTLADFTRLTSLIDLYLGGNRFTGSLPSDLTKMTSLQTFDVSNNQLTGAIPDNLDRVPALQTFDVSKNQLTGSIPATIGRSPSLRYLGLADNGLTGSIPSELGNITSLEEIVAWGNQLTGSIPDLRRLSKLTVLYLASNRLSGSVPDWLGALPKIDTIILAANALTGPIPASITSATTLVYLDLGGNQLTGAIPSDIGRLQKLAYLTLADNEIEGPIPDSLWDVRGLVDIRLDHLHLNGALSARAGGMNKLSLLLLGDNDLSGALPSALGSLSALQYLGLYANRFTGTIPRELGQLKNLQYLDLSGNNLRPPIPAELTGMTSLVDARTDFGYNALSTTDPTLRAFMNLKQYEHDFTATQTLTPSNVRVTQTTDRSATVEWTAIAYIYDEGGYQVRASLTAGGAPVSIATTSDKSTESITVRGLQPATTYFFTVASVTHPHDFQRNVIVSDQSAAVSAITGARVLSPPDVVITDTPKGLIQIDGKPVNEDSFTLTNFGDVATSVTVQRSDDDFFSLSPDAFTLGPGASQIVKVTSNPKPPGVYYGYVSAGGPGTHNDSAVTITLLSVARAGGGAVAEALTSRVEVTGLAGSDSVGSVTFRNRGTASLTGILVADQPWIVPNPDPIAIDPGSSALVRFQVVRSRRPPGVDGTLTGTLSLIYVGALPQGNSVVHIDDTTPPAGIQITKVTVVDVTKPDVVSSNAPQLSAGEVAFFIAGLTSKNGSGSTLASDLRIVNSAGSKPATDVRLYYTSASQNAVATLGALGASQSVSLANVVANVYGGADQTGSIQVRSQNWKSLTVNATLLRLNGTGTLAGEMPVFRSDRALRATQTMYLTGVRQSSSVRATLYLEDIAGSAQAIRLEFLDAAGTSIGSRDVQLPAFATSEITDLPVKAVTILVTNVTTTPGSGVLAYARMSDDASGDTWSVVDWPLFYAFSRKEPMRLPLVQAGGAGGGKRRAVKHSEATSAGTTTAVSLFNSGTTEARVKLTAGGASREFTVPVRQTLTIDDVASSSSAQTLVIEPLRGEITATSRASTAGTSGSFGTAVPVVSAQSGLRLGQGQIFSGLEDSSASRTDYGFVETGGAATTIRATLLLSDARSLFTTVISKDFRLDAGGFIFVSNLVKSILGSTRDTQYGDLHNLQLQLEVTEGAGSILPFVTVTDTKTGDGVLRLE